jgi:type IV pilus assembly protein PilW
MNKTYSLKQQGFSLIEVMVAMAIGIILLGAVSYLFIGGQRLNRTQDDVSRIQENGRIAQDILGKAIRLAGSRTQTQIEEERYFSVDPNDALKTDRPLTNGTTTVINPIDITNNAGAGADSFTVRYHAQLGGERDCSGTTVAADSMIVQTYSINTSSQLVCTSGVTTTVLVEDVVDMQITVGIDTGGPAGIEPDGNLDSYVTANSIAARDYSLKPWSSPIAAMRLSLLIRSANTKAATNFQTYTFNGATVTATDLRLYQAYTATYNLRNLTK